MSALLAGFCSPVSVVSLAGAADDGYSAMMVRRQARIFLCRAVSATVSESRAREWSGGRSDAPRL